MFEPITLTLTELADRWNRTPRQIIEGALHLRIPLYFSFDGLVFDVADHWHRFNGDWEVTTQIHALSTRVEAEEAALRRSAASRRGELKLTEWEDEITPEGARELRNRIEVDKVSLRSLHERLEQREIERRNSQRNGLLRAGPATLQGIMERGGDDFPTMAYDPASPVWLIQPREGEGAGPLLEGRLLALEQPRHPKGIITGDDLFALMSDVKACEATTLGLVESGSIGRDPQTRDSPPPGRIDEHTENERLLDWLDTHIDARYWFKQPAVSPRDAAVLLCNVNPEDMILPDGSNDQLGMREYQALLTEFEALQRASPEARTLLDWWDFAIQRQLVYHEWIELWIGLMQGELNEALGPIVQPDVHAARHRQEGPCPWEIHDPRDPEPEQPWFTAVRYFARLHVRDDATLLSKRTLLLTKVATSLKNVGVKKRGAKKDFQISTLKKALSNVLLS